MTLIELMIVLVIVGILAALVYPSYRAQVERAQRVDAKAVLVQDAQLMERIFTEKGTYTPDGNLPPIVARSPVDGSHVHFNIALTNDTDSDSFGIVATPTDPDGGGGMLSIDNTGLRGWDRDESGAIDDDEYSWDEH